MIPVIIQLSGKRTTACIDLSITGKVEGAPLLSQKLTVGLQMLHASSNTARTDGVNRFDVFWLKCQQQSMASE